MNTLHPKPLLALAATVLTIPVFGQFYEPITLDPSLTKFLDENSAFTATVEVTSRRPDFVWPVRVSFSKGMARVEMDISKMREERKEPTWESYVGQMQKAGSAECVWIFNPARKSSCIVLPKLKAYVEGPIPDDMLAQLKERPKPRKVELGTEDIDGRSFTKTKISFNKDEMSAWRTWETPEAIIWTSKNSPVVPVRMVVLNSVGDTNLCLAFKDIRTNQLDSALFEPPKGFAKCDEPSLMKRIMEKWPEDK